MSHLQRVYTDYYYRTPENGNRNRLDKYAYLKKEEYVKMFPMAGIPGANGDFPCKHEERGFLSKNGKKRNRTHARMKRNRKYRVRARNAR